MNICWIWKCNHINKRCLQHDTSIHLGGETETRTCRQNTCSSIRLAIASLLKHPKRSLESTNLCVNSFLPLTSYLSLNWLYIYCSTALVTEKRSYFSSNCLALLQRLIPILCDTKIYKIIIIRQGYDECSAISECLHECKTVVDIIQTIVLAYIISM